MFIVITILECYNLFFGVELSKRSFFVIFEFPIQQDSHFSAFIFRDENNSKPFISFTILFKD